jgi:predicted DNA-binding protein YlxM (UPF0122 family)
MDDKTLKNTMLFDFYGDLLTSKQREYYDLYHNEDWTLTEIAKKAGITRQGIHNIIKGAENALLKFESKTGALGKWVRAREDLKKAEAITRKIQKASGSNRETADLSAKLLGILGKMQKQLEL